MHNRAVDVGPMTAQALCAALVRSLIGCIERYIGQSQPLGGRVSVSLPPFIVAFYCVSRIHVIAFLRPYVYDPDLA